MIAKQIFTFHDELISGPDIVKCVAGESVILRCDPHSAYSKARKGAESRMAKYLQTIDDLVTNADWSQR